MLARPGWRFVGVLAALGAVSIGAPSCYRSPSGHCEVRCDPQSGCPGGLACDVAQGRCVAEGQAPCSEVLADGPVAPLPTFTAIDVGAGFACALDDVGGLWCWGDNRRGQLGLGAPGPRARPTRVGREQGFAAVSAGGAHACAVRAGELWCWGDGGDGQLGLGDLTARDAPTQVALTGVSAVSAGERHTCAVATGGIYCWGDGAEGKLGQGSTDDRDTPGLALAGAGALVAVSAGANHTCGHDGAQAWCWGRGNSGQLGDGGTSPRTAPTQVVGLPAGITAIAVGYVSTCAIAAGGLWCWGQGGGGELGPDAGTGNASTATQGAATTTWTAVAAAGHVGCGLDAGQVRCWGNPTGGGIPDGRWNQLQHASEALGPASDLDLGYLDRNADNADSNWMNLELGCWIAAGALTCWGDDGHGALGQGRAAMAEAPRQVPALAVEAGRLSVGGGQVCAGTASGLRCWGSDRWGELTGTERGGSATACRPGACDGTTPAPTPIADAVEAVAGHRHTCARTAAGALTCWGNNDRGQLGPGGGTAPRGVTGTWLELGGGGDYTCGRQAGGWECWGGLVGPVARTAIDPAMTVIRARGQTACGLSAGAGQIWCWGDNGQGQFGDGGASSSTPRNTGRVATALAVGEQFGCAVVAGGQVECWGRSDRGQAGVIAGAPQAPAPIRLGGSPITGCTDVGAGVDHACAACGDQLVCWGDNRAGQLGQPAGAPALPAVVMSAAGPWAQVRAGDDVSCAVTSAGALWCWGQGNHGQLGDGSHASNLPLLVP